MRKMKILNNTRYHEGDLQEVVDLFVRHNPKWDFRWGTGANYPSDDTFSLVFMEASVNEGHYYMGPNIPATRTMVGRTAWKSPHRVRLLQVDRIVTNPVESLAQQADLNGFYTAPFTFSAQLYHALEQRFSPNRYSRSGNEVTKVLEEACNADNRPYTIRYRFGPKRRASAASRELEFQHTSRTKLGTIAYRARQSRQSLEKMVYEMRMLLKNAKDRTSDMPFDPVEMQIVLDDLTTNVLPALNRHAKRN